MNLSLLGYYFIPLFLIILFINLFFYSRNTRKNQQTNFNILLIALSFGYLIFTLTMTLFK
ncbi:hypothetical protein KSI01_04550 [Kurthia sibirica]|nr:hypothetical protein KSI01_04550 [Kurthia sibirica]